MTELEKVEYAKQFIDSLANGINPIDGSVIPDEDVVNNVHLSRCFFYVSGILRQVIENQGIVGAAPKSAKSSKRRELIITDDMRRNLKPYEHAVHGGRITELINDQIPDGEAKLKATALNKWLTNAGFLEKAADGTRPTAEGRQIGIFTEDKFGQYGYYTSIMFSPQAQQFVLDNIDALAAVQRPAPLPARYLKPWSDEEVEKMLSLYNSKHTVREIATALERTTGAVRTRLKSMGFLK